MCVMKFNSLKCTLIWCSNLHATIKLFKKTQNEFFFLLFDFFFANPFIGLSVKIRLYICPHWFINNFRFFGGGIRGVFGGVVICFSNSLLSSFRVKNQVQILKNYHQTSLFTIKILFGSLTNE